MIKHIASSPYIDTISFCHDIQKNIISHMGEYPEDLICLAVTCQDLFKNVFHNMRLDEDLRSLLSEHHLSSKSITLKLIPCVIYFDRLLEILRDCASPSRWNDFRDSIQGSIRKMNLFRKIDIVYEKIQKDHSDLPVHMSHELLLLESRYIPKYFFRRHIKDLVDRIRGEGLYNYRFEKGYNATSPLHKIHNADYETGARNFKDYLSAAINTADGENIVKDVVAAMFFDEKIQDLILSEVKNSTTPPGTLEGTQCYRYYKQFIDRLDARPAHIPTFSNILQRVPFLRADITFMRSAVRCHHGLIMAGNEAAQTNILVLEEAARESSTFLTKYLDAFGIDTQVSAVRPIILDTIKHSPNPLALAAINEIANPRLQHDLFDDEQILRTAVQQHAAALQFASDRLKNDETIVGIAVEKDGRTLFLASEALRNTPTIVVKAIKNGGRALAFASNALRSTRDIALQAIKNDPLALQCVLGGLERDYDIVLTAVQKNGLALEYADPSLQKNKTIVVTALHNNGCALEFAPKFRDEDAIVLIAVRQNGRALAYASERLRDNFDIVKTAVGQNPAAFEFASNELRKNFELIMTAVEKDGRQLRLSLSCCNEEPETMQEVFIDENGDAIQETVFLQSHKALVLAAVKNDGDALRYASAALKRDLDIVFAAIENSPFAIEHVHEGLKTNREFLMDALQRQPRLYHYIVKNGIEISEEVVQRLLIQYPEILISVVPHDLITKNIAIQLMIKAPWCFYDLSRDLREDPEILALR